MLASEPRCHHGVLGRIALVPCGSVNTYLGNRLSRSVLNHVVMCILPVFACPIWTAVIDINYFEGKVCFSSTQQIFDMQHFSSYVQHEGHGS
jgi:hypothetical protein